MRFSNVLLATLLTSVIAAPSLSAAQCRSVQSGMWSNSAVWSCSQAPTAADDVIISGGHVIERTGGADAALTLEVEAGGNLTSDPMLDAGPLPVASALTIHGGGRIDSGRGVSLAGGIISSPGSSAASRGVIAGPLNLGGSATLAPGSFFEAAGPLSLAASIQFTNYGDLRLPCVNDPLVDAPPCIAGTFPEPSIVAGGGSVLALASEPTGVDFVSSWAGPANVVEVFGPGGFYLPYNWGSEYGVEFHVFRLNLDTPSAMIQIPYAGFVADDLYIVRGTLSDAGYQINSRFDSGAGTWNLVNGTRLTVGPEGRLQLGYEQSGSVVTAQTQDRRRSRGVRGNRRIANTTAPSTAGMPGFNAYELDPASVVGYALSQEPMTISTTPVYGNLVIGGTPWYSNLVVDAGTLRIVSNLRFSGTSSIVNVDFATNGSSLDVGRNVEPEPQPVDPQVDPASVAALTFGTGSVRVGGDWLVSSGLSPGSGTWTFDGMGDTLTPGSVMLASGSFPNLQLNNAGATFVIPPSGSISTGTFGLTGDLDLSGTIMVVNGDAAITGRVFGTGGNGGLSLAGNGGTQLSGVFTFDGESVPLWLDSARTIVATAVVDALSGVQTSGSLITNLGHVIAHGVFSGGGDGDFWVQGSTARLDLRYVDVVPGSSGINGITLNATAPGNRVIYSAIAGAGASQTVDAAFAYYDLELAGAGDKLATGPLTINGTLQIRSGVRFAPATTLTVAGNVIADAGSTLEGAGSTFSVGGDWNFAGDFVPNGALVSFDGSVAQAISAGSFGGLRITNITAPVSLQGDVNVDYLDIASGSDLIAGSATILVRGSLSSYGTLTPGTSTVIFDPSTSGSIFGDVTFHNVTFRGTNVIYANILVGGALVIEPSGIVESSSGVTLLGNFINDGIFTGTAMMASSVRAASSPGGTLTFDGTSPQFISGTGTFDPFHLVISNAFGVAQMVPLVSVSSELVLDEGIYSTPGTNKLYLEAGAVWSRVSGWVSGSLRMDVGTPDSFEFPMGTSTGYGPLVLHVIAGSGPVTVSSPNGPHPSLVNPSLALDRWWLVDGPGISDANLQFTWPAASAQGTEAAYLTGRWDGAMWNLYPGTVNDTNHSASLAGLSSLSAMSFTAGELNAFFAPATQLLVCLPGETYDPNSPGYKTGTSTAQPAGSTFSVSVFALDASGNVVSSNGDLVSLTSSDAQAILPPNFNLSAGMASVAVTMGTAGTHTLTATDVTDSGIAPHSASLAVVPGPVASFTITAVDGGAIAPQTVNQPFDVRITAYDASGNVVTGFNESVSITSTGALGSGGGPTAPFASGTVVHSVSFSNAGAFTLTATSSSLQTGTSAAINVSHPPATSLLLVLPGESYSSTAPGFKTGTATQQTAGTPFTVTVYAISGSGQLAGGNSDTLAFSSTDSEATLPSGVALSGGSTTASITMKTSGVPMLTVSDVSNSAVSSASANVVVIHGAVATLKITDPNGAPIGQRPIDEPFQVRITAYDAWDNVATSFNGIASVSSNGPLFMGDGPTAAFASGSVLHTVGFSAEGEFTLTASTSGGATGTSGLILIDGGCPSAPILVTPANGSTNQPVEITFVWGFVEAAESYRLYVGDGGAEPSLITETSATTHAMTLLEGDVVWFVEAVVPGCPVARSAVGGFTTETVCRAAEPPLASVVGEVKSGENYTVQWDSISGVSLYEIQEAPTANFVGATSKTVADGVVSYVHSVTEPTAFFYRVRSVADCNGQAGPFSPSIRVVVIPLPSREVDVVEFTIPFGNTDVLVQEVLVPMPEEGPSAFTAETDRPWLRVVPTSGSIGPDGASFTIYADPKTLPVGSNTGTLIITFGDIAAKRATATTPKKSTVPVSISLVTPVKPVPKNTVPGAGTLIIPSVGHVKGMNSEWRSDVRITNTSGQRIKYKLNFTPTATDARIEGKQTEIEISPGQTVALDDVVKKWYGVGALNDGAIGVLEIRPENANGKIDNDTLNLATVASSRTYNLTANGTFGQYIPAIPFSSFIAKGGVNSEALRLSLQQVSQTATYRSNFGVVEGAGQPATVQLTFFGSAGEQILQKTLTLAPGEQRQLNQLLAEEGIELQDGRMEVSVLSDTGRVTAYASTVDNRTGDPILVPAVRLPLEPAERYVVPGVADLTNSLANWKTDLRVFNPGSSSTTATFTFHPQNNSGAPVQKQIEIPAGRVTQLNDLLQEQFGIENAGGAVHVASSTDLVVTARTYNETTNGTYGQFIPAVTAAEAASTGTRAIQILQVQESERFRTNLGLVEVSGQPAEIEITVADPGSIATPIRRVRLEANEFRQINRIVNDLNLGNTYNTRISVKVVSGAGRVAAYASVIDNRTQDPTYVPGQ